MTLVNMSYIGHMLGTPVGHGSEVNVWPHGLIGKPRELLGIYL